MSFQDILDKVLLQAKGEAEQILLQARVKAEALRQTLQEKGEADRAALDEAYEEKLNRAKKKSEYLAHLEGRNRVLEKKKQIIDFILKEVVKKLSEMPAKQYEQILADLMKKIHISDGVIRPADGKGNSTKGAIKISGKTFKMGEPVEIQGGFLLESELADFDYSFETIVFKTYKSQLEDIIVQKIF